MPRNEFEPQTTVCEIHDRGSSARPAAAPPSTRAAVRRATYVTAAGILAIVGVLAAGYYYATRPEVLRIAVGPANSDDVKVVQTLTRPLPSIAPMSD